MCVSVFFSCYFYVVEWQHFYRLTKQIAKRQLELGETVLSLEIIIFDEWLNTNRDIETEVNEWHCIICSLQLYNTYATCLMTLNNVWMTLAHLISIHFILVHIFMRTIFFSLSLDSMKCCHLFYVFAATLLMTTSKQWLKRMKATAEFGAAFYPIPLARPRFIRFLHFHFRWNPNSFSAMAVECYECALIIRIKMRSKFHTIHFHHNHVQIITTSCFWYVIDCSKL